MNYIKLINAFWQKRRERPEFDPYVISLFFALVSKANNEGWKSFEIYREDITALSGMSPSVYYKARKTLKDAGFINFQEGASKLSQCRFNIIQLYSENTEAYTEGSTVGDTEETQKPIQKEVPSIETNKLINPKPLNNNNASLSLSFENGSEDLKAGPEKPKEKSSGKKEKVKRDWKDKLRFDNDSPELRAKWEEWIHYKTTCPKAGVNPYSTQRGEQAALTEISKFSLPFALWAIDNAIDKEWQGIVNESTIKNYDTYANNPTAFLTGKANLTNLQSNGQSTYYNQRQQQSNGAGPDLETAVAMSRLIVGNGYKQAG